MSNEQFWRKIYGLWQFTFGVIGVVLCVRSFAVDGSLSHIDIAMEFFGLFAAISGAARIWGRGKPE